MKNKHRPIRATPEHSNENICGIGTWRPNWIQGMATAKTFLFIVGITTMIQSASYMYMIASVTTLEKRYAFGSKLTGLILICDNFMELIFFPVFGYLANKIHRPRMIGISQVIVGIGLYFAALPYFIYGPGVHLLGKKNELLKDTYSSNKTVEYCNANRGSDEGCKDNTNSSTVIPAVFFLCLSMALNGVGSSAFFAIGIPFVDDSVKKRDSALYISFSGVIRLCGPTLGFLLSGLCLRFYENPFINPGIEDIKDPRWIGAWWIGFVVLGTGIIVTALPIFLFPRELKTTVSHITTNGRHKLNVTRQNKTLLDPGIWQRVKRLLKNPIYMCYVIGTICRLLAILGYVTFKAKYIETQYKKSASAANLFSGAVGIVPAAIGILLGGLFIRQFQPGPRVLTSFITIVEMIGATGLFAALFLGCPATQFAGIQTDTGFSSESMCNDNCFCTERVFQPICGPDNQTNYFSPCFAGCSPDSLTNNQYSNCKCLSGPATEGYCETNCGNNFDFYITLLGISNIVGNLAKSGNSIISFRIVDPRDKSFSIGLTGAFLCIFAFIPYPLVYGAVTDAACLVWKSSCGEQGNCWIYDSDKFRKYLHATTLALYFFGSLFDIIVIFLSNRIKNLYTDETDVEEESSVNMKLRSSVIRYIDEDSE